MAISYINTIEVENVSKELNSLVNELETEINNLFTRLFEVPTVTGEWVGEKSQFYFNAVANEKKQYNDFVSSLRNIVYKLNVDVYEIQSCMNKCNKE